MRTFHLIIWLLVSLVYADSELPAPSSQPLIANNKVRSSSNTSKFKKLLRKQRLKPKTEATPNEWSSADISLNSATDTSQPFTALRYSQTAQQVRNAASHLKRMRQYIANQTAMQSTDDALDYRNTLIDLEMGQFDQLVKTINFCVDAIDEIVNQDVTDTILRLKHVSDDFDSLDKDNLEIFEPVTDEQWRDAMEKMQIIASVVMHEFQAITFQAQKEHQLCLSAGEKFKTLYGTSISPHSNTSNTETQSEYGAMYDSIGDASDDIVDDFVKGVEGTVERLEEEIHSRQQEHLDSSTDKGSLETVMKLEDQESDETVEGALVVPEKIVNSTSIFGKPPVVTEAKSNKAASTLVDAEHNQYVLSRSNDLTSHIEDVKLFHDIVYLVIASTLFGFLFRLVKLPPFFGYMLAGVVLGPTQLNQIRSPIQIETLAQFGVLFILFALGLEFSIEKVKKNWRMTILGGVLTMVLTTISVMLLGYFFGFPLNQSIFLGATISLSSTTVVLQCVGEEVQDTSYGRGILGILIIQDVGLGFLLAVLPLLSHSPSSTAWSTVIQLAIVFKKMVQFGIVSWFLKRFIVGYIVRTIKKYGNSELSLLASISLCFAFLLLSDYFGIAIEVGCFVAGIVLNNRHVPMDPLLFHRIEAVRDVFASLFFASIGLHIYPHFLLNQAQLMILITFTVMGLKILVGFGTLHFAVKVEKSVACMVSVGLSQVSEFAFVLSSRAKSLGIIQKESYYVMVGITSVSLMLTPFLWQVAYMAMSRYDRNYPGLMDPIRLTSPTDEDEPDDKGKLHVVTATTVNEPNSISRANKTLSASFGAVDSKIWYQSHTHTHSLADEVVDTEQLYFEDRYSQPFKQSEASLLVQVR